LKVVGVTPILYTMYRRSLSSLKDRFSSVVIVEARDYGRRKTSYPLGT